MSENDINFDNITKEQILKKYIENLNQIRLKAGLNENDFHQIMLNKCTPKSKNFDNFFIYLRRRIFLIIFLIICAYLLYNKHQTSSIILRNIQVYIYPGMRLWRKITLPIISRYPSLTEYYDESCLLNNPLFQVLNLTCDPCMSAISVIETKNYPPDAPNVNNNIPFIFRMNELKPLTFFKVKTLYHENENCFKRDAYKIISTNKLIKNFEDLIKDFTESNRTKKQIDSHSLLRSNRMSPARILRQIFPKPQGLPSTGLSLERFLLFDTPRAQPYRLPDTECSNIFLIQGYGSRNIILRPTTECRNMCRTLSVLLGPSHVLVYNWWYWKPVSMPDKSSYSSSMTYVGSYC